MTCLVRVLIPAVLIAGLAACNESPETDRVSSATPPAPAAAPAAPAPAPAQAANASGSGPQLQLAADMELSSKVKDALQEPARNRVEVDASDGVVTLYGTVDNSADKDRLALAAMNVEGVRSVVNNLVVMRSS